MVTLKLVKKRFVEMARLQEEPWKIALGMAVGIFISLTPFFGLHTLMAVGCAILFGLNKFTTITGSWVNLPWIAPFAYALCYKVGQFILLDRYPIFNWEHIEATGILEGAKHLFLPLFVGCTLVGIIVAALSYPITIYLIKMNRKKVYSKVTH